MKMARGYLYCSHLEVEQKPFELLGQTKLGNAGPGLLRQVVGHLEVHVVRRNEALTSPACIDDLGKLLRNVNRPLVVPAAVEPRLELCRRVEVKNIHVELTLLHQAGVGQI